jgi:general L-amino acid transport system permease protein
MSDLSYVRTEMLDERDPPTSQTGFVKWARENLFSSVGNGILTLLSIFFVYKVLAGIMPWAVQSSWTASSLTECREVIAAAYGEGTDGACWSVITERYKQLLFGFYPSELYWRPILAFILLGGAIAPVLFDKLPRNMLMFSAIYPFLGFWLIWGGSIWLPICVMLAFVIGNYASVLLPSVIGSLGAIIAAFILPIIWWLYLAGPVSEVLHSIVPIGLTQVPSNQLGGFMLSILIGIVGVSLSLPIGILLALGRQSSLFVVKTICVGFIEFIRGVPLITLLFVASTLLNYFLPPGTNFDLVLRVMIMVTLFASAYMAEVVRGGLAAIPTGQYEAAAALGLDFWKSTRLIVMPQALKISIPNIVSNFIGLFKDTTLVSIIGLLDPLGLSTGIRANQEWNGVVWELYAFIALMFWIVCFSMSRYSMYLERKLKTGH